MLTMYCNLLSGLQQEVSALMIPKTISKLDINKFLGYLANKRATGKTRYRKIVAIKKFFAFLKENEVIKNKNDPPKG